VEDTETDHSRVDQDPEESESSPEVESQEPSHESESAPKDLTFVSPGDMKIQIAIDLPIGTSLRITAKNLPTQFDDAKQAHRRIQHAKHDDLKLSTIDEDRRSFPVISFPSLSELVEATSQRLHSAWDSIRTFQYSRLITRENVMFSMVLLLYLVSRVWGIDRFPIFFYSDEANNVLFGEEVFEQGFRGRDKELFPVYFEWDRNRWAPVLPVYIHATTSLIFGKSIFVARATAAIFSLIGVITISWLVKRFFAARFWWASALLMLSIPAWFLYTRTAFETVIATVFYACTILFYLLYRYKSPKFLYSTLLAAAGAFYSYANLQIVSLLLLTLLIATDIPYHLKHRHYWTRAFILILVLAIPFIRYRIDHPTAIQDHLTAIQSYWTKPSPITEKLLLYGKNYIRGLSPTYWFAVDNGETNILPNQHIPGMGNLSAVMLPLMVIGIAVSLRKLKSPAHRAVLLSALVVPAGAAMDSIEIPRVLAFVVPSTILATLGLEWISDKLRKIPYAAKSAIVVITLSLLGVVMFRDSLVNGPTWYPDYGLNGMQYGVKQVFAEAIPRLLQDNPEAKIIMTTTWANRTHLYPQFFLSEDQQKRVIFGNVKDFMVEKRELDDKMIIGMTPPEFTQARFSPVLEDIDIVSLLYNPTTEPAFYFARISYIENVDEIFLVEQIERQKPVETTIEVGGQTFQVLHSRLNEGIAQNMFDGSFTSFVRGESANPFTLEIRFPETILLNGIKMTVGTMGDFTVTARLISSDSEPEREYTQRYIGLQPDPTVELQFHEEKEPTSRLIIEVRNNALGVVAQTHIREFMWQVP
jgi:4-amino-4-deoxy-L-arabinose transferase-like glycosyltransferase